MGDPILAIHRHSPRFYELTSLRTASLRDQLLRASLMIDRLLLAGELLPHTPEVGLLVIGAGASGLCAAWTAALRGVEVTLVEAVQPFDRQARVSTRHIDPVEFDWPQPHWALKRFPVDASRWPVQLPLGFPAAPAATLAQRWALSFHRWHTHTGGAAARRLRVLIPHRVDPTDIKREPWPAGHAGQATAAQAAAGQTPGKCVVWTEKPGLRHRFGAVMACTGFGQEVVSVPGSGFVGLPFWEDDNLANLTDPAGQPLRNTQGGRLRVLVSGGGDGAQQDFLRTATGRFGRELFHELELQRFLTPPEPDQAAAGLGPFSLDAIWAAEDAGRRAHAWRPAGVAADDAGLLAWHEPFERLAAAIWKRWEEQNQVQPLIDKLLKDVDVTWALPQRAPGHCYALNRLLVLLVARLLAARDTPARPWSSQDAAAMARHPGAAVIRPSAKVLSIAAPPGHVCGSAAGCFNQPHQLVLEDNGQPEEFDVIVLRHGMQQPPHRFFGGAAINEQMVPYNWP